MQSFVEKDFRLRLFNGPDGAASEQPLELAARGWSIARVAAIAFDRPGEWRLFAQGL